MGDFNVRAILSESDRAQFYTAILRDLKALDLMLNEGLIDTASNTIGAEQEICIVNSDCDPSPIATDILERLDHPLFTNELALYNMEFNARPQKLKGSCFNKIEHEILSGLKRAEVLAEQYNSQLFLTGILPSLCFRHLRFEYMTPEERYKVLSREFLKLRGSHFEIFLQGVDDFSASLDSILFEACNTSFQLHLQIDPNEFAEMYNWAQMISGPVLSACTNAPFLFGKELWAENRIALFKQSLDTRNDKNHSRTILPRVYFGKQWLTQPLSSLWKEQVVRFPLLLSSDIPEDPIRQLQRGQIPNLRAIRLHNGTTYTWNRLCYGVHNNVAHVRIECRYLPAGPSVHDEIANFAFWIGLMKGMPQHSKGFWRNTTFKIAKNNFIKAARGGLHSVFHWFGKDYSAQNLILDHLLPLATQGLQRMNVSTSDIDLYLSTIEARVLSGQTGSMWHIQNHRALSQKYTPAISNKIIIQESLQYQKNNTPIHQWNQIQIASHNNVLKNRSHPLRIEEIMITDVISIKDNLSVAVAQKIMQWKSFNHLPVQNLQGQLVGMISTASFPAQPDGLLLVRDIMTTDVVCAAPHTTLKEAQDILDKHRINSIPVIEDGKLVGIVSSKDLTEI